MPHQPTLTAAPALFRPSLGALLCGVMVITMLVGPALAAPLHGHGHAARSNKLLNGVHVPRLMHHAVPHVLAAHPLHQQRRAMQQQSSAQTRTTTTSGGLLQLLPVLNLTCASTAFATAMAAVQLNCSMIDALAAGALTQAQFLSTFCATGCAAQVQALFGLYADCIPGSALQVAAGLTAECTARPECYTAAAQSALGDVYSACFAPLTNLSDISSAAQATVQQICSGSGGNNCTARIAAAAAAYPQCFGTVATALQSVVTAVAGPLASAVPLSAANITRLVGFLCSTATTAGGAVEYCAWNLRSLGRVDCDVNCGLPGSWCSSSGSNGGTGASGSASGSGGAGGSVGVSCTLQVNNSVLGAMCTSCLGNLSQYAAVLGEDATYLETLQQLYCMRTNPLDALHNASGSDFCLPLASAAFPVATSTTSNATGSSTSGSSTSDNTCDGALSGCLSRYGSLLASTVQSGGAANFSGCMRQPYATMEQCLPLFEYAMAAAHNVTALANLVCARNANGTRCWDVAQAIVADPCFMAGTLGVCPAGCLQTVAANIAAAGCCLPWINEYLRALNPAAYVASYLPTTPQRVLTCNGTYAPVSFTAQYSASGPLWQSQQPLNAYAVCSNTSALWSLLNGTATCPATATSVFRRLKVNVAWELVRNDTALFNKVLSALRADVANAIGCDASLIRNDTLTAEPSISLTVAVVLGDNRTLLSAGVAYSFYVAAGAGATTASSGSGSGGKATAGYDQQAQSAGGLGTPNTGATCASSCPTCAGSTPLVASDATPASDAAPVSSGSGSAADAPTSTIPVPSVPGAPGATPISVPTNSTAVGATSAVAVAALGVAALALW